MTASLLEVRSPRRRAATAGSLLGAILIVAALVAALDAPARAAAAQAPKGFFGVNISSILETDDYGKMAAADVGTLRTGFLYRNAKQHRDDPWDWTSFDELAAGTATNGIDLIPVLYGVPPWISTERGSTPLGRAETAWREYLTALVERYGPGGEFWSQHPEIPARPIRVWQAWNEPNSRTWWRPKPDPKEYGKLLVLSAKTIHAVDPRAEIMTAGIVAEPTNAAAIPGERFLRGLFRSKAARRATDLVGFHPYAPTTKAVQRAARVSSEDPEEVADGEDADLGDRDRLGQRGAEEPPPDHARAEAREPSSGSCSRWRSTNAGEWASAISTGTTGRTIPMTSACGAESSGLLDVDGLAKPLLGIFSAIARLLVPAVGRRRRSFAPALQPALQVAEERRASPRRRHPRRELVRRGGRTASPRTRPTSAGEVVVDDRLAAEDDQVAGEDRRAAGGASAPPTCAARSRARSRSGSSCALEPEPSVAECSWTPIASAREPAGCRLPRRSSERQVDVLPVGEQPLVEAARPRGRRRGRTRRPSARARSGRRDPRSSTLSGSPLR